MRFDTVIIGAGLSGLAAGIRLAHFGRRVCLCERHTRIGGLNSWYERGGRRFDVGLHALTNLAPRQRREAPINRLFRQLRLSRDELHIVPQRHSRIVFPGCSLRFSNDFAVLEASVAEAFPAQHEAFQRLVAAVRDYDVYSYHLEPLPARKTLAAILSDPLLIEMLLCPVMYYGNAQADDMDFRAFCILFRSLFLEGVGRPAGGIRPLLDALAARLAEAGAELRLNCGVRTIACPDGAVTGVSLDDGTFLECDSILSSAGHLETLRLCDPAPASATTHPAGCISFIESIFHLDCPPADLGLDDSILFLNRTPEFAYRPPAALADAQSTVLCLPGNFGGGETVAGADLLRVTSLANPQPWLHLPADEYRVAKAEAAAAQLDGIADIAPLAGHARLADVFTPRTVLRYTGHLNGAVYGSPRKLYDGRTPIRNLFLCGTDQGFLGIVGALLSGVSMANYHLLAKA
ncbi:MAG: Phytoene desaturase (neurosporene-forming) [Lentisphaerae bacterium ADurb.BinA184]|nr:MAG: Phytoene desaturase (neurosporene-forming) [Lentisphaerae bacterium ADurb.BinA184]